MFPIKKILWPTDFSEPSYEALETAKEFAKQFSAEIVALNVTGPMPILPIPDAPVNFDVSSYQDEIMGSARKHLEMLTAQKISGLKCRSVVVMGDPPGEIVRIAEEEKVDLIVISTHGRTGFRHFIFGSVAEKVVQRSNCPVLVVRAKEEK